MAVIKVKEEKVVEFFLGIMQRDSLGPGLVTRVSEDFFKGAKNDTVTLRVRNALTTARDYEWRTRNAEIVMDDIEDEEDGVAVKLDTHIVHGTTLTDEHVTLDLVDFGREVIAPQAEAVTKRMNAKVVAGFRAAPFPNVSATALSLDVDPHLVAIEARRILNGFKVAPTPGRYFMIGSDVEAAWLASDRLSKYDSTGQTGTPAVRDAIIGRLAGYPVVVNSELLPNEAYLAHPSALVMGNVAPVVPRGVAAGRTIARDGYAVRWIADYDPRYLRDRSVVSSFFGITSINDERDANGKLLAEEDRTKNVRGLKLNYASGGGSVLP